MGIKSILLAATALFLSGSVNAGILVENFSEPFPAWESGWLGLNSNIQNYWGAGSTRGADFLWITDGDAVQGSGETVAINFATTFGLSLTSLSIDIGAHVNTTMEVYDGSGSIILDSALTVGNHNISILSSNGISGFSLFSSFQVEGNTSIDNVVATSAIPAPAATWLFGSGLLSLVGLARRKSA